MSYIEIIEEMVREIFVVETDEKVQDYYYQLLSQVYAGKRVCAIPFKLANMDQQKFVEKYLDADALYKSAAENANLSRECSVDGKVVIKMYFATDEEWSVIATGQI